MATTDAGGGIVRTALRGVVVVVAVFAALMVWFAISALAGPAESSLDAVLQGAVSSLLALGALAVLVVYAAGDLWAASSRSDGGVASAFGSSPLLAAEVATAPGVVVLWLAVGAISPTELVDQGTLEALGWVVAAVSWAFCAAVVARSGRVLLHRVGEVTAE